MKIKDAVIEKCKKCNHYLKEISPEVFGCDECKKVIDLYDDEYKNKCSAHLDITIFYIDKSERESSRHEFCSWKCVYKYARKIKGRKDIDFISLPLLSFDRDIRDKYCGDFFKCIK